MIKVTVWEEYVQSRDDDKVKAHYPNGIHEYIAGFLGKEADFTVRTANLHQPENGLPDSVLDDTDVLLWWGHVAHEKVEEATINRVQQRVLKGMGIIFLHSAHYALPFIRLMGTSCSLSWRENQESERLWVVMPQHPIVAGVDKFIELEAEETYGEFFDIPEPDQLVMVGWYKGGDVFRSLCTWNRGFGKVVYFQPGHETNPTYHKKPIQDVIINAVRWAYAPKRRKVIDSPNIEPWEKI